MAQLDNTTMGQKRVFMKPAWYSFAQLLQAAYWKPVHRYLETTMLFTASIALPPRCISNHEKGFSWMSWQPERHHPTLFRAGDIEVSSEWRDLSYDWWPIVTMAGIGTYTMLRDSYAHQRNLFPFLLEPEGPAKTQIQYMHGYKTGNALRGTEYLLEVIFPRFDGHLKSPPMSKTRCTHASTESLCPRVQDRSGQARDGTGSVAEAGRP
ncbi:MAG: hypothetical protein M3R24_14440 [Chloroflexota bacterium]|nr:hypothetical protein [Chloroflexota bacterium]